MSYEQEFMKEFEAWVNTQIMINDMAHKESQKVYEEDKDERAKDAMIRYESRLDAYQRICLVRDIIKSYKKVWSINRTFYI